ncbi:MAG: hypothetical protein LBV60_13850, partial [Streptomyces sp.]|nr:hypothetical protein [Streptomyces sp.]
AADRQDVSLTSASAARGSDVRPVAAVPATPSASAVPVHPALPATPSASSVPAAPSALLTAPASPLAPVRAGGGGTAHQARASGEARSSGPGIRQAIIGLVLASVAAVAVVVRSVRKGRGKE